MTKQPHVYGFHKIKHKASIALLVTLVLVTLGGFVLSCSSSEDSGTDSSPTTSSSISDADGSDSSVAEQNTDNMAGHHHATVREVSKDLPIPTLTIEVSEDPLNGWNLYAEITDFRLSPENASTVDIPGEGHMHLYIDGVKTARLYSSWYHISELAPGEHTIKVTLSSNDHAELAVDGEIISDSQIVLVPGLPHDNNGNDGSISEDDNGHHHTSDDHHTIDSGESSRYDADVADADTTIPIKFFEGEEHTLKRVTVDLDSVVALNVQTDISDSVHVHGYDVLHSVDKNQPAHFAFNAQIPGTFEVELESSGILLLLLTVS
ncbi:MAG: hypothetical protein OXI96_08920 [Acidimicrobiaceae bacterium]|nr:hypothetical protein [Acidimicrobiaceae bacterium]